MSVDNNDFVNKEGTQVYMSNVYLYDQSKKKVIEMTIRDNNPLVRQVEEFLGKIGNVNIDLSSQKGGYGFFVNVVGISKNGKE